jgi:hypothetical protein
MKHDAFSIIGLFLVVIAIASIVTGYGSGLAPSVLGHSSDEIKLDIVTVSSGVTCTNGSSTTCTVACPSPGANDEYVVMSGTCQSLGTAAWRQVGSSGLTSWTCQDMSHTPGQLFTATVYCLKGGKP